MKKEALVSPAWIDLTERERKIQIWELNSPDWPPRKPPVPPPRDIPTEWPDEIHLGEIEMKLRLEEGAVRLEGGRTDISLRRRVGYVLLFLFAINTFGALSVIYLVGLGWMVLTEKVIIAVLGATVVQAATMLVTVVRYLFRFQ